jgi:hypothetical protein
MEPALAPAPETIWEPSVVHEAGVHQSGAARQHHRLEVGVVLPQQPDTGPPHQVRARSRGET